MNNYIYQVANVTSKTYQQHLIQTGDRPYIVLEEEETELTYTLLTKTVIHTLH